MRRDELRLALRKRLIWALAVIETDATPEDSTAK